MLAAVLTTFLFAVSAIFSTRAARSLGPLQASVARLSIAVLVLGIYAYSFGQGLRGPGLYVFLISGLIGFGLGDIALFHAYRRLGARLAILLAQCLAVPFAASTEWLWLGTVLRREVFWIVLILLGICLAVLPSKKAAAFRAISYRGIIFGVTAALGQAGGAVLSRKAIMLNEAAGVHIDGATASFQRILAGVTISTCILWLSTRQRRIVANPPPLGEPASRRSALIWLCLANALAGPILGISCYQWALTVAPSAVVLTIVATTPIVILPLAWALENDRPSASSLLGSVIAVGGVIGLLIG